MNATTLVVALVMAVGVAGTVVPFVPGISLVWAAGLAYGLAEGFDDVGVVAMGTMTFLAAAGIALGVLLPARVAGRAGAARSSILLGALGAVVGFFVVPVLGAVVGGVAGVFAGEQMRTGDGARAWKATRATLVGFGFATLAQFVIAMAMAGTWAVWALVD